MFVRPINAAPSPFAEIASLCGGRTGHARGAHGSRLRLECGAGAPSAVIIRPSAIGVAISVYRPDDRDHMRMREDALSVPAEEWRRDAPDILGAMAIALGDLPTGLGFATPPADRGPMVLHAQQPPGLADLGRIVSEFDDRRRTTVTLVSRWARRISTADMQWLGHPSAQYHRGGVVDAMATRAAALRRECANGAPLEATAAIDALVKRDLATRAEARALRRMLGGDLNWEHFVEAGSAIGLLLEILQDCRSLPIATPLAIRRVFDGALAKNGPPPFAVVQAMARDRMFAASILRRAADGPPLALLAMLRCCLSASDTRAETFLALNGLAPASDAECAGAADSLRCLQSAETALECQRLIRRSDLTSSTLGLSPETFDEAEGAIDAAIAMAHAEADSAHRLANALPRRLGAGPDRLP